MSKGVYCSVSGVECLEVDLKWRFLPMCPRQVVLAVKVGSMPIWHCTLYPKILALVVMVGLNCLAM